MHSLELELVSTADKVTAEEVAGTVLSCWSPAATIGGIARPKRATVAGLIDHALSRANARMRIFEKQADDVAFEQVLEDLKKRL